MLKRNVIAKTLTFCFVLFCLTSCQNNPVTPWQEELIASQQDNKYTIILVDDGKSGLGKSAGEILDQFVLEHSDQVNVIKIDYEKEKDAILSHFKMKGFKELPATLIVAPNGALTGVFGQKIDKVSIENSLLSPKEADLVLSMQKGQAVFLCLYDNKSNSLDSVKTELSAIEKYFQGMASVMYIDISNDKEASLVKKLPNFNPITVLAIIPPGQIISKFEGAQIKQQNMLQAFLSACGSGGCGPSGCK